MGVRDYEKAIYLATGLPDPDEPKDTLHYVGEWAIHEAETAIDAIVQRRLTLIRRAQEAATSLPREAQEIIADQDFLNYSEYLDTVRRMGDIRTALLRLDNQTRKQYHDAAHYSDKPHFYQTIKTPNALQTLLARSFDVERHTADREGYLAYMRDMAPELSKFFFKRLPALIPESDRAMHTYITGSSGSGKSELMKILIHSYAQQDKPPCVVVLDPHGKFADEVAGQEEIIATDRLVYINPALSSKKTPTLNPFDLDDPKAAGTVAAQLMGVFDELFRRANHAGLTGNMAALLIPCMTALLRMPNTDLLTLQQLFCSKPKDQLFKAALDHMSVQQRRFIEAEWEKKRYETTKDAIVGKIQTLMNSEHFMNFLCGPSTIDLDTLIKDRKTICFSMQKGEIDRETISAMGGFVMAAFQAYVLRKYKIRKHNMVPIHLFVDECHNFLSPTVTEILEEARKFGLHLTLAQQYAGQKMDTDLVKTVLGNTAVKVAGFNNEKSTHREMARLMDLDEAQLVQLEKRRFYVKAGDKAAIKLYPPSNLADTKNCVSRDVWRAELAKQKRRYYRPVDVAQEPSKSTETQGLQPDAPPKPNLEFI